MCDINKASILDKHDIKSDINMGNMRNTYMALKAKRIKDLLFGVLGLVLRLFPNP